MGKIKKYKYLDVQYFSVFTLKFLNKLFNKRKFCKSLIENKNLSNINNLQNVKKEKLQIIDLIDIVEKPVEWLWPNWIPLGKLTVIAGEAGTGKTNIMMSIASIISRGLNFPDESTSDIGRVLMYSTEDAADDTLKPRAMGYCADLNKISILECKQSIKGENLMFSSDDVPLLEDYVKRHHDLKLIIIDPIVSIIQGDMYKANVVRNALDPLSQLAEKYNCAIVCITHFSKNKIGKSISESVLGSQAFIAKSRMVLTVLKSR